MSADPRQVGGVFQTDAQYTMTGGFTNALLTTPTVTTPTVTGGTFSAPVLSGQGIGQVAVVSLAGTAWHTGVGQADTTNWQNNTGSTVIITRLMIYSTHASTGVATVAAGTTVVSAITAGDNLLDDWSLQTSAPAVYSNLNKTDTEVAEITLANGGWVTFTGSASVAGFLGNAYIFYFTV